MPPSASSKQFSAGPRRRGRQNRDDEGLDEAPHVLDDEPADMERVNPVEENESIQSVDEIEDADDPYE